MESCITYMWYALSRDCLDVCRGLITQVPDSLKNGLILSLQQDLQHCSISRLSVEEILSDAPALAREINVALASDDTLQLPECRKVVAFATRSYLDVIELTSKYGSCIFTEGTLPTDLEPLKARLIVPSAESRQAEQSSRSLAAGLLLQLRQVAGLYARLTYKSVPGLDTQTRTTTSGKLPSRYRTSHRKVRYKVPYFDLPSREGQVLPDVYPISAKKFGLNFHQEMTLPYSGKSEEEVISQFKERVQCQSSTTSWRAKDVATKFWYGFSVPSLLASFTPSHGPGAVAEGYSQPQKELACMTIDERYQAFVPESVVRPLFSEDWMDMFYGPYGKRYRTDSAWDPVPHLVNGAQDSKVRLVPKDYRGPRVIAMEPCLHQYIQQGVRKEIERHIRHSPFREALPLWDQCRNRELARRGSIDCSLATIDLSDASDTVRVAHLKKYCTDELYSFLEMLRTRSVSCPDHTVVETTTAFPMGSALCFVMESCVYLMIALDSIATRVSPYSRLPSSITLYKRIMRECRVSVYGDDIIVSKEVAPIVVQALQEEGMLPNLAKCCTGRVPFRESCGYDAFFGHDVAPLRPRHLPGSSDTSLEGFLEMIASFASRGYIRASAFMYSLCMTYFHVQPPVVPTAANIHGAVCSDYLYYYFADQSAKCVYDRKLQQQRVTVVLTKQRYAGRGTMRHLRDNLSQEASSDIRHDVLHADKPAFKGWPLPLRPIYELADVICRGWQPRIITRSMLREMSE